MDLYSGYYVLNVIQNAKTREHNLISGPYCDQDTARAKLAELKPEYTRAYVSLWVDLSEEVPMVENELYCVAKLGSDGKVIPGSRLSGGFSSPSAAFDARDAILAIHPDANVFSNVIVDRLAALN